MKSKLNYGIKKSRYHERLYKCNIFYASASPLSSASAPLTAPLAILTEATTAFAGSKNLTPGISIELIRTESPIFKSEISTVIASGKFFARPTHCRF